MKIIRSKPNPAGKDLAGNRPLASQLLGEWVDVQNTASHTVTLAGTYLANETFDLNCIRTKTQTYWDGPSIRLMPNGILRIHTGRSTDQSLMRAEDISGADAHSYAEKSQFALNNRCGDTISFWLKKDDGSWSRLDYASYSPNPSDGKILVRMGDRLL